MKYNMKWTIYGFLIPIIGIIVANRMDSKKKVESCSLRRGSALSTLFIFVCLMIWLMILVIMSIAK